MQVMTAFSASPIGRSQPKTLTHPYSKPSILSESPDICQFSARTSLKTSAYLQFGFTPKLTIPQRLDETRKLMKQQGLDYLMLNTDDEHLTEMVPAHRKRRDYISGLVCSSGDFLLGHDSAFLMVDRKYHEPAETHLRTLPKGTMELIKMELTSHTPLIWNIRKLAHQDPAKKLAIGYDPFCFDTKTIQAIEKVLKRTRTTLKPVSGNLIDAVVAQHEPDWPKASLKPLDTVSSKAAGQSVSEKLDRVFRAMSEKDADILPLTLLDQTAWLMNLRGQDFECSPTFTAYALLDRTRQQVHLFTDNEIPSSALPGNVKVYPYQDYQKVFKKLLTENPTAKVLLDGTSVTQGTLEMIREAGNESIPATNPINMMKAVKNPAELHGMQQANLRASVAVVRGMIWMDKQLKSKTPVTEIEFADQLERFYRHEPSCTMLSFPTIAGAGGNGSVIHGHPKQDPIQPGGILLYDSGAQYLHPDWMGTTDKTRTIFLDDGSGVKPQPEQIKWYTNVLKGHINLAKHQFTPDTSGKELAQIAWQPVLDAGGKYEHGISHGVGNYLNVHEGPNRITQASTFADWRPGMVGSNEPGQYHPGEFGIRLENLYHVVDTGKKDPSSEKPLYGFESLNWMPFDKRLIDQSQLDSEQMVWLKGYHQKVYEKLSPLLNAEEQQWLKEACTL